MQSLFLVSLLLIVSLVASLDQQFLKNTFQEWKQTHEKVYTTDFEESYRFKIFTENYIYITEFNQQESDMQLGLNQFADMTLDEFSSIYLSPLGAINPAESTPRVFDESEEPPKSVDWRAKGAVTHVKNQQACGSCWAFASVGALEGLSFINNSKLYDYSEQHVIDCDPYAFGCQGGWPMQAFNYTAQKGIEQTADYPLNGGQTNCSYKPELAMQVNDGYYNVTPMNVTQLKLAVAQQPVAIVIQAYGLHFMYYRSGVMKRLCGWQSLDHVVLIVGYDIIDGEEAWIVKNSWGTRWGEKGYIYMSTDATINKGYGICGLLQIPSAPTPRKD
jgi:xylem cysteine proteinase